MVTVVSPCSAITVVPPSVATVDDSVTARYHPTGSAVPGPLYAARLPIVVGIWVRGGPLLIRDEDWCSRYPQVVLGSCPSRPTLHPPRHPPRKLTGIWASWLGQSLSRSRSYSARYTQASSGRPFPSQWPPSRRSWPVRGVTIRSCRKKDVSRGPHNCRRCHVHRAHRLHAVLYAGE